MQRVALIFAILIFSVCGALAQSPFTIIGAVTPGHCVRFFSTTQGADAGFDCTGAPAVSFANPTGAVGLTAVNGAATTAMRSDAAPPLSSSVQSALTGTGNGLLLGTGAFGFGATAAPTTAGQIAFWNGSSWVFLTAPSTAGSFIYWNGTTYAVLAGNTVGSRTLTEDAAGNPSWSAAGAGSVTTPGSGLVSSTTAACSQTANQSTLYNAECVNAQTGTSYAIADGDRAKLITASNAAAQAYTIPQAGAASNFQSGWYTDIKNISTAAAGIVTITPTTSTINGASTFSLWPGQSVRIISDGTNYQVEFAAGAPVSNSLGADVLLNNTTTFFDGPSMAQGSIGTWQVTGTVTLVDTAGAAAVFCKLWDGTTVIDSGAVTLGSANQRSTMTLSGALATPAGNMRISCEDNTSTSGKIVFNASGLSKDSTISGHRLQ